MKNFLAPAVFAIALIAAPVLAQEKPKEIHGVIVTYKACAGGCWQYPVESFSVAQMREMKPSQFCYAKGIMDWVKTGTDKNGNETGYMKGNFHGYFKVEDCKKMSNLKPESAWWFINPTLDTTIDACRADILCINTLRG